MSHRIPKMNMDIADTIDESSSRARISRYELGVHEPPVKTARLLAQALGVPLAYLYCDDDGVAELLLQLRQRDAASTRQVVADTLNAIRR